MTRSLALLSGRPPGWSLGYPHAPRGVFSLLLVTLLTPLPACAPPGPRLNFPPPTLRSNSQLAFDTTADGVIDFRLRPAPSGRLDLLCYDDDADGIDDRVYRLSDYHPDSVPHLIILLDSIPFQALADRWRHAHWSWFDPPQKVIPPFPTMSGVIFSRMLHAPPQGGMINQHYDRAAAARVNRIAARARGSVNPWELRLHYRLRYWENGLSFLRPRSWFAAELARAKRAFDNSPDRVTIVYFASTAGMLSRHGRAGLDEALDGLERLCLAILHQRLGAVKISVLSDHGHSLIPGSRIDLPAILKDAGFHPRDRLRHPGDVVVELDGLVNYAGIHTRRPAPVAAALAARPEIELAIYLDRDRVIVHSAAGRAAIDMRAGLLRYSPIDADPLDYLPVIDALRARAALDPDGFAHDHDWFAATLDHHWPDAPRRLWDAFHGLALNTPDVMLTTAPGYFVGLRSMERFITMASTHGGLNQPDSATFVLTMTGRANRPMRTHEVLPIIEPAFDPGHKPPR